MTGLTFFILCLEGAILSFNVAATAALIPSIAKEFALSNFLMGKAVWLYMIPYGLAALIYGPLVRRFDAKNIELICIFFFSLANILAGLASVSTVFFLGRFLMGVFGASVIPLGLILIARSAALEKRGRLVGIFFSATFVASLLGLFLSGLINWRLIYLLPGFAGLLTFLLMYFGLPSFKEEAGGFKVQYLAAFKSKRVIYIFTYIFFVSLFYHSVQQWLAVYFADRFNFTQFLVSMLITITSLSGIFGEIIGGISCDKFGRLKTIKLGIALMALSVFLLLLESPFWIFAVLMLIWGLGWTMNHAGLSTMLTDLPKQYLNEAASLNSGVRFISGGLGMALGGLLLQRSFILGFLVFGMCFLILLFCSKSLVKTHI